MSNTRQVRTTWADRLRPLWRLDNRIETFLLRRFGHSPMSVINRGDVLVLETKGRRSGRRRFAPVGYWQEDGAYIVAGSAAGMATVPDWVRNLRSNPDAAVWLRRSRCPVVARELTGQDRVGAARRATEIWPRVPHYEEQSGRPAPYFRLHPTEPAGEATGHSMSV